jgi:2,3-bisphosphoglycerate-dependent phosphoglycerate mutase
MSDNINIAPKPEIAPLLRRKDGATELYLIRHADALPGEEIVIPGGGYDDQPLSKLGQTQATALADWLAPIEFDAIYASSLRRTQETAAPLARRQNKEIIVEPSLREVRLSVDKGPQSGDDPAATAQSLRERMEKVIQTVVTYGKWSAIPGSEPSDAFRARVVNAIGTIAARHAGQRIAVFSHGGFINAYFAVALGLENDFFFPIFNTSYSIMRWHVNRTSIISLNELGHLRASGVELD